MNAKYRSPQNHSLTPVEENEEFFHYVCGLKLNYSVIFVPSEASARITLCFFARPDWAGHHTVITNRLFLHYCFLLLISFGVLFDNISDAKLTHLIAGQAVTVSS